MDIDNHYKTLSVPENASNEELQQAHRKLTMQYHPDHHPNDEVAAQELMQVQIAFLNLFDPVMRKEHDEALRSSRTFQSMGNPQQTSKEDAAQTHDKSHPWVQTPPVNQAVNKRPLRFKKTTLFGFAAVLILLVFLVLINLYKVGIRLLSFIGG